MLKFASSPDPDTGRIIIGLGLTTENVRRLQDDQPIHVRVAEMVPDGTLANDVEFLLYHGTDELALRAQLLEAGLIGPDTEEHIDPRLEP